MQDALKHYSTTEWKTIEDFEQSFKILLNSVDMFIAILMPEEQQKLE